MIFESPSGGLHVYLPLSRGEISPHEHTWPAAWGIEWVADRLRRAGVRLEPGRLELFPSGQRLRAPCGPRMTLLRAARPERPDDLGLEPVPGTFATKRKASPWSSRFDDDSAELVRVRRPWAQLAEALAQWEATRRPLDAWLGEPRAAWSAVLGPFARPEASEKNRADSEAAESRSQHIGEVQGRGSGRSGRASVTRGRARLVAVGQGAPWFGSAFSSSNSFSSPSSNVDSTPRSQGKQSPLLRYGREFREYVHDLLQNGVTSPGGRHDAVLALVFAWHVAGKSESEVRAELEAWCRGHAHVSTLQGERFVKACMREGMHYYERIRHLPQRAEASIGSVARLRALTPADERVLAEVDAAVRDEARVILEYLHGHASVEGDVLDPVRIGRAQLGAILADRRVVIDGRRHRADVLAVRELERLGVLALYLDYSVGKRGRRFSCWYRFGSGQLPTTKPAAPRPVSTPSPTSPPSSAAGALAELGGSTVEEADAGVTAIARIDALVLAERQVAEGTLRVLGDGQRGAPWVELEPAAGVVVDAERGGAWWRAMYERRLFSVRDLRAADESRVIAGPWQPTPRTAAGTTSSTAPPRRTPVEPLVAPRVIPMIAPVAAAPTSDALALASELEALGACSDLADVDPELAELALGAMRRFDRGGS